MTRIFNLNQNSAPVPGPNFFYARDKDGKSTGRHTFTVCRGALGIGGIQARFKKGTPITALDPSLSAFFSHLLVVDFDSQDLPGGYSEVTVNCEGYTESGEFETDREITYSSQTSMVERSMLLNPVYLSEVRNLKDRRAFTLLYNSQATAREKWNGVGADQTLGEVKVETIYPHAEFTIWTDESTLKWYKTIFINNRRTYEAPAFEWTKETANAGGLTDTEVDALGKRDTDPPGTPPKPSVPSGESATDWTWLKVVASDTRGESSANTVETWQWAYWPADEYPLK